MFGTVSTESVGGAVQRSHFEGGIHVLLKLRKWMSPRVKDERGFTLVELLMVMVIIGVLAALGFTGYNALQKRAAQAQADTYWRDLNTAARMYQVETGSYPTKISNLVGTYLDNSVEPWASGSQGVEYYMGADFVCVRVGGSNGAIAGPSTNCGSVPQWTPSTEDPT